MHTYLQKKNLLEWLLTYHYILPEESLGKVRWKFDILVLKANNDINPILKCSQLCLLSNHTLPIRECFVLPRISKAQVRKSTDWQLPCRFARPQETTQLLLRPPVIDRWLWSVFQHHCKGKNYTVKRLDIKNSDKSSIRRMYSLSYGHRFWLNYPDLGNVY